MAKRKASIAGSLGESVRSAHRYFFSPDHIRSAALFARQSYAIEAKGARNLTRSEEDDHRAYVTGAIMSSVAFLEATINEHFADVAEENQYQDILSPEAIKDLRDAWIGTCWSEPIDKTKPRILDKYTIFLQLARDDEFDRADFKGGLPYQNVLELIGLRNDLMHFKTAWTPIEPAPPPSDRQRFLEQRFAPNPLAHPQAPYFYLKVLGHGCAAWAVDSSVAFVELFHAKTGLLGLIDGRLKSVRPSLSTK
jgi:hypothetical protein